VRRREYHTFTNVRKKEVMEGERSYLYALKTFMTIVESIASTIQIALSKEVLKYSAAKPSSHILFKQYS
jgi:hypothetical protein